MFLDRTTISEFLQELKQNRLLRQWHPELQNTTVRNKVFSASRYSRFSLTCGWLPEYRDWNKAVVFILDLVATTQCPVGCLYCFEAYQVGGKADRVFLVTEEDLHHLVLALHQLADYRWNKFGRKTNILLGQKVEIGADVKAFEITLEFLRQLLVHPHIIALHYTKLPRPKLIGRFNEFKNSGQLGWLVSLTNWLGFDGMEPGADPIETRIAQYLALQDEGWPVIPAAIFAHPEEAARFIRIALPYIRSDLIVTSTIRFQDKEKGQAQQTKAAMGKYGECLEETKHIVKYRLPTKTIKEMDSMLFEAAQKYGKTILLDRVSVGGTIKWKNPVVSSAKPCANGNTVEPCRYKKKRQYCDGTKCKTIAYYDKADWLTRHLARTKTELAKTPINGAMREREIAKVAHFERLAA